MYLVCVYMCVGVPVRVGDSVGSPESSYKPPNLSPQQKQQALLINAPALQS